MKQDAVEYIKENIEPRILLEHYDFKKLKEYESEFRACCAIHGGDNESGFIWNKANNLWYCYTGECGGGDAIDLVMKIEHCTFKEAVQKLSQIFKVDISNMSIISSVNNLIKEHKQWLEKQRKLQNPTKPMYKLPTVEKLELPLRYKNLSTFVKKSKNKPYMCNVYPISNGNLYNKIVFPLYENNECVGVALRDSTGEFKPKWMFQPKGLKVSNMLYGYDEAVEEIENGCEEIILVEGILDVLAFNRIGIYNVVAIFGSSISDEQYRKILKLGINVVFCFDNDDAGNKCYKKAVEKFKYNLSTKKIELPIGCDPEEITPEELQKAYKAAK